MSQSEPCSCSGPGYCQRYKQQMVGRLYELCANKCPESNPCSAELSNLYRKLWDEIGGPLAQKQLPTPGTVTHTMVTDLPADASPEATAAYQKQVELSQETKRRELAMDCSHLGKFTGEMRECGLG